MDVVCKVLDKFCFTRVCSKINLPIVVHCVPGAGKSTAIRQLLQEDKRFFAITFGVPDAVNLTGCRIRPSHDLRHKPEGSLLVIDEYTECDESLAKTAYVVFGDPLQTKSVGGLLAPHYIRNFSRRFGGNTSSLLRRLGFDITGEGADLVEIFRASEGDLVGEVIAYGPEAEYLLCWYGVPFKRVQDVRGSTFEVVTLVTDYCELVESNRADLFVCLTRHKKHLRVLNSDAALTATGQH